MTISGVSFTGKVIKVPPRTGRYLDAGEIRDVPPRGDSDKTAYLDAVANVRPHPKVSTDVLGNMPEDYLQRNQARAIQ